VNELQDKNAKVGSTNGRKRKTAPPKQAAKRGKKTDDKIDTSTKPGQKPRACNTKKIVSIYRL
jgi:hypothetical protein